MRLLLAAAAAVVIGEAAAAAACLGVGQFRKIFVLLEQEEMGKHQEGILVVIQDTEI
jgi:predicted regulator of Ras-like GTPase activity (Roadblock/LC7/MglB family)